MPGGIRAPVYAKTSAAKTVKGSTKGKVRLGIIIGPKNCDPILKGTHDKDYPEALKVKNNFGPNASGWGGQYQVDTTMGLRLRRKYPDVFAVDIIPGSQITPQRLAKNHLNLNLGYDMINAFMAKDRRREILAKKAFTSRRSQLYPEWDLQDFVYCKDRYLKGCKAAGVAIAPTIFLDNGIKPADVIRKVKAKGWPRFFIKPSKLCSYGFAAGKFVTKEVEAKPSILSDFAKNEGNDYKNFLLQPYITKPDGKVFDEVRNWFVDGKWSYGIFTSGSDDDAVWPMLPKNKEYHLCAATKKVAEKTYKMFSKRAKWRGKSFVAPMTRVDVGCVPVGKSKTKVKCFVNEIEMEAATWLVRYVPYDIVKRMARVYPKKILELINGLGPKERRPDAEAMRKLEALVRRLFPEGDAAATAKRKAPSSASRGAAAKRRRARRGA